MGIMGIMVYLFNIIPALPLRTLNCGNNGIFLVMGNAGFISMVPL